MDSTETGKMLRQILGSVAVVPNSHTYLRFDEHATQNTAGTNGCTHTQQKLHHAHHCLAGKFFETMQFVEMRNIHKTI